MSDQTAGDSQDFATRSGDMFPAPGTAPLTMDVFQALEHGGAPPSQVPNIQDNPDYQKAMGRFFGKMDEADQIQTEKDKKSTQDISDLQDAMTDANSVARPQLKEQPGAPQQRSFAQDIQGYLGAFTVLAALAGGAVRGGSTTALNAFAGAIKGFTEGRKEVFEQKYQEWKAESEKVLNDNQTRLDNYNMIMKEKQLNITEKMTMAKMVAQQYDDRISHSLLQGQRYEQFAQFLDKSAIDQQKAIDNSRLLDARVEYMKQMTLLGGGRGQEAKAYAAWYQDYIDKNGHAPSAEEQRAQIPIIHSEMSEGAGVGRRAANLDTVVQDAINMIPDAKSANAASAKAGQRSHLFTLNEATNRFETESQDPNMAALVHWTNEINAMVARSRGGTGGSTDAQLAAANQGLDPRFSPKVYASQLAVIERTLKLFQQGARQVQQGLGTAQGGAGKPLHVNPQTTGQDTGAQPQDPLGIR